MKNLYKFSAFVLLVVIHFHCQSQANGHITGQGDVVKEEISLGALTGINLGFHGDVVLTQGSPQKIIIEGQQNIIQNIRRDVKNGTWNIHFDKNVRDAKNVVVHITLPTLREVGVSGSGSVKSTNKFSGIDHLDLNVAGSGNMMLDYTADVTDLNLSGSGQINLMGSSNSLSISIAGSGDVDAKDLAVLECEVQISGSGNATVNASKNLDTHITGSGDVQYTGTAAVNSQITGSGTVNKIN